MTGKTQGALPAERTSQEGASELDLVWQMHEALSRGVELDHVLRLVVEGARPLFAGHVATIYFLDDDRRHLLMQNWALPEKLTHRIEKLTGLDVRHIPLPLVEDGHYWRVIEKRQTLLLNRPEEIEAVVAELASGYPAVGKVVPAITQLLGHRSILIAPLVAGDRVVGVMDVGSRQPLSEADRHRFQLLASQVGLVIELARAKERERKQAAWLALANDIGRRASATLDLEVLLREAVEAIHTHFGYQDVLIAMVDHQTGELVHGARAGSYTYKAPPGTRKPIDPQKGILDWVALHGETLLVNDVTQEPRYVALFPQTRSELCVPIKRGNRVLGVLNVESVQPAAFDQADVAAMETLADYLVVAIENARLYEQSKVQVEELQRTTNELRSLQAISQAATSTLEISEVMQTVAEGVVDQLGYTICMVFFYREAERQAIVAAVYPSGSVLEQAERLIGRSLQNLTFNVDPDANPGYRHLVTGEPWLTHSLHEVARPVLSKRVARAVQRLYGTRSFIVVPARARGKIVGVIFAASRQETISQAQQTILAAVADQAAVAIENARLYDEVVGTKSYLENLIASSIDCIATTDEHGILIFVSSSVEKIAGYKPEEIVGQPMWKHYVGGREEARKMMDILQREGELRDYETWFWHKDGHKVPVSLSVSLLKDEQGNIIGSLGVSKDITERKELEEKLSAIYELGREMVLAMDEEQIAQAVLDVAARVLQVPASALLRVDEERQELQVVARRGYPEETQGIRFSLQGEEGIVVAAARAGELVYVPDTRQDPRYFEAGFPGLSDAAVPLKVRDRVIGVLSFESRELDAFDQADLELLSALADQAAIAIENAHLYQETQQHAVRLAEKARSLEAVHRVSTLAGSSLDLEHILSTVAEEMVRLFAVDHCGILLFDPAHTCGQVVAEYPTTGVKGEQFPVPGYPAAERIIAHPQPLPIEDTQNDPLMAPVVETMRRLNIQSMLILPLVVKGEVVGSIGLDAVGKRRRFSAEEIELAQTIANQVAIAIGNARLYEEEQKKRRVAEALREVSRVFASTLEPEEVLDLILEQSGKVVNYDSACIMLLSNDTFKVAAGRGFPDIERTLQLSFPLAEDALGRHIFETRQPLVLPDAQKDERYLSAGGTDYVHAWMGVPLIVKGEVIGLLTIDSRQPNVYNEETAQVAQAFADQAAIAIENARLYEETSRRAEHLAVVNRIAHAAGATLRLDELVEIVCQEITRVFQADAFFLALYDPEINELDFRLRVDEGVREPPKRRPMEAGLTALVVTSKKPLLIQDFEKQKDRLPPVRVWGTMKIPPSWLGVPMLIGDRVVGVISVQAYRPQAYGEEEQFLLSTIADQVAVAVENARLYEETRRRLVREERLNELAHAVGGEMELATLIPRLLPPIAELTGADAGTVAVFDPERDVITYPYHQNLPEFLAGVEVPAGSGLAGHIMQVRRPVLLDDYRAHPAALQPWVEAGVRSTLGVPLLVGEQVVGALGLFSLGEVRPFGPGAVAAAEAAGRLAAVAIQRARLFEAEQRRRQEAETLREVAQALNRALSLEGMLDIVLREAVSLVGREEGSIILLERRTNTMRIVASYGLSPEVVEAFNSRPVYAHEGTFGVVLQTGEMLEIPDARSDPRVLHDVDHVPEQLTNVPLRTEEGVIGVIALDALPPDERARRLLLALGDLASTAIQRTRLFEAERRKATQLALISEIGKKVASVLDLGQLMQEVPRLIQEAFDYYNVAFLQVDEERRELVMQRVAGGFEHMEWEGYRQSVDEGIMGFVARTGKSWMANDVSQDPYYIKEFLEGVLTKSELCVPVKVGDKVIGVLDVQSVHPNSFDQEDVVLMKMLADRIAIGVENARLFEEARRRAEEVQLLFEATRDASTSLELDQVLESVAAHLCRAAKATSGHIMIFDESGERVTVSAQYWSPEASPVERTPDVGTVYDLTRHPIILQALRENRPLVTHADDPNLEPATRDMMADFDGRSALRIPMHVGGVLRGYALIWESRQRREWTDEEVRLCQTLANQAAVAIENARLFADVERAKTEWETTFDAITDCILLVGPDFRVMRTNRTLAERLGSPLQALIGQHCYELVHQATAPPDGCPVVQMGRSRKAQAQEMELPALDGTFLCSAYPLFDAAGQVRGAVYVLRDITEQKRMQERLLQTEKLAAIGELVSGVAHELNNPLAAVLGYAQLLQAADVSDEVKHDLEKICHQAQRAARIVTNLLDFARMRPPEKKLTDVNDLLQRSLALRAYEMQVGNIQVETELAPDLPWVAMDPYQMQQVFLNVIINAEQAMGAAHGRGTLRVRTSLVQKGEEIREPGDQGMRGGFPAPPLPCLLVSMADDGPGIPAEILPRVFDPFFTTKEVGQGTGLGLSIAYGIVTGHRGRIWAESPNEWGGATFYVELPVLADSERQIADSTREEPSAISHPPSANILVVDDEESIGDLLTRMLRREGCRVDVAGEGEEALRKLEERRYGLIICDIKMPGMSGPELYQRVQETDPDLARRIIFTTGDTVAPQTQAFLDETGNPYVAKPFDLQRVRTLVQALLRGEE